MIKLQKNKYMGNLTGLNLNALMFFLILSNFLCANNIDSLKVQLEKRNEREKTDILIQLSKAYWTIAPSKGIFYANEAIKLAEKYHEKQKKAKALLYGGVNNWFIGDYNNAIEYYQKSLTIAREINDKTLCAFNLNNLGMVNTHLQNYERAIENYTESSHIIEELGDKIEYAKIQNNIAQLEMLMGNLDTALKRHLSVIGIIEKSDEQVFLIWLYNDIGTVYKKKENEELALQYFNKALKLSNKINNTLGKSQAMNRIGEIYLNLKEYKKANDFFLNALKYATDANSKEIINETYKNISEYYLYIDDYKKSLKYYKLYKQMSDSIINDNKIRTIIEMQARYNLESAENENNLLQKNIEIKELTIKKNNTQRTLLVISLLLTSLLIILTYNQLRIKKKKNDALNEKNALINKQKDQLSNTLIEQQKLNEVLQQQKVEIQWQAKTLQATNKKLLKLDQFKEGMTGMIVHDLKNPLNSILNSDNIDSIKQAGKQMLNMVMNILDVQKFEDAKMKLEFKNCSAYTLVQNAYNQVVLLVNEKNITFENNIKTNLGIKTEPGILERVFVNLFTNAIKYTPSNGIITIYSELKEEIINNSFFIIIKVSDTGQGIPADKIHLVFEKFGQIEAKESGSVRSTGLGLAFCKLAVEAHGGQIGVESEVGEGSTFWFTIPLGTEIENTRFVEPQQSKKEINSLSETDKQMLFPLLSKFKELEVYEVSDIRELLDKIELSNSNLWHWVEEMKNVLRAGNEVRYLELLNLIENGKA